MDRNLYDISMSIYAGMLTWPGNPRFSLDKVKSIADGDSSNISLLRIGTHTGTHVDAPRHFINTASGVDSINPTILVGPARLVQLPEAELIDRRLLSSFDLAGVSRLLLGTRNSALLHQSQHTPEYAYLTEDGAEYLVEKGIKLIGIDYLSIEQFRSPGHVTHRVLLEAGLVIVEGLDLSCIPPGEYELICLPLKLKDADGAPARALLREL
ncbi:MAG: cyclase family protein [Dehalococcoidia bacterium]